MTISAIRSPPRACPMWLELGARINRCRRRRGRPVTSRTGETIRAVDDETRQALQRLAGESAGVPPSLHSRLQGESLPALKRDAEQLHRDLFGEPERPRDERGRFSSGTQAINDEIRRRAGYPTATPAEPPIGSVGIGRGASALPRQAPPPNMNALIRGTVNARRGVEREFAEQIATQEALGG